MFAISYLDYSYRDYKVNGLFFMCLNRVIAKYFELEKQYSLNQRSQE
jgi:hypothetical protein